MDTPWKVNGWNLKITCLKRKIIPQTFIFGNRFNFQKSMLGCQEGTKRIGLIMNVTKIRGMKSWVCRNFFWQNDGISISLAVS